MPAIRSRAPPSAWPTAGPRGARRSGHHRPIGCLHPERAPTRLDLRPDRRGGGRPRPAGPGRVEARTAETGVEIAVSAEKKTTTTRRSARPSKAKPISDREDSVDDPADSRENPGSIARTSPARPRRPIRSTRGLPVPASGAGPNSPRPSPGVGWKQGRNATASHPERRRRSRDATTHSSGRPDGRKSRPDSKTNSTIPMRGRIPSRRPSIARPTAQRIRPHTTGRPRP